MRIFAIVAIVMIATAAPMVPRTSPELHALYGKPNAERFNVRPDITLSVEYGEDGETCAMRIEPRPPGLHSQMEGAAAPMQKMTEIVDEIVPMEQRGSKLAVSEKPACSFGGEPPIEYENVTIKTRYPNCSKPMIPRGIEIHFKRPACDKVTPDVYPRTSNHSH